MTADPGESAHTETATLGGGCFWCLEAVFERVSGVQEVVSGYAGGHVPSPTYERVCTGTTGHAEVVQLRFDPRVITYREILEVFFSIHDPTTRDRQGEDVGPQYRSAIFHRSEAQRTEAERLIRELAEEGVFDAPIVTEVQPLDAFYQAEAHHQGYYRSYPNQPYCRFVIAPKLTEFRRRFADRTRAR